MSRWDQALFGAVSVDLLLRVLAELVGGGSLAAASAGVGLFSRYVLDLGTVVWAYSWALLWVIVFQLTPVLFPQQSKGDWTESVLHRALLASAGVTMGVTFEGWVAWLETMFSETSVLTLRVFISPAEAVGILCAVGLGYLLVSRIGQTPLDRFASRFGLLFVPQQRAKEGTITVDRYLLAVFILGILLGTVALLFPIPELLIIGLQLTDFLVGLGALVAGSGTYFSTRSDIAEGMIGATLAVWGDLEELFHIVYVLAPLAFVAAVLATVIKGVAFGTVFVRQPVGAAVLISSLLVAAGHVLLYSFRLCQRIRDRKIAESSHDESGGQPLSDRARIPLLLLPVGILMAVVTLLLAEPSTNVTTGEITKLDMSAGVGSLAVLGTALAIVTVNRPSVFGHPVLETDLSDESAAALATFVVVFLFTMGSTYRSSTGSLINFTVATSLLAGIILSLYLGPRILLGGQADSGRKRLTTGVIRAIGGVFVGSVILAPFASANASAEALIQSPVLFIIAGSGLAIFVASGVNAALYALLLPFYLLRE